jgi:hypothetical protein
MDIDDEFEATQNARYGFRGTQAPVDIAKIYLGKRILDELRKKGSMSPVRYSLTLIRESAYRHCIAGLSDVHQPGIYSDN